MTDFLSLLFDFVLFPFMDTDNVILLVPSGIFIVLAAFALTKRLMRWR